MKQYTIFYIDDDGTKQVGYVQAKSYFEAKFVASLELDIHIDQILEVI